MAIIELPIGYDTWRPGQEEVVESILTSSERFIAISAPTGSGKSLIYMTAAQHFAELGMRVAILTGTKGLQDQLQNDFGHTITDVRGMNNYTCLENPVWNCDKGICTQGEVCELKEKNVMSGEWCYYYEAVAHATNAPIVSTNYAFYLAMQNMGRGIGDFDVLVLDEAHDARDWVNLFLEIKIPYGLGSELGFDTPQSPNYVDWRRWATDSSNVAEVKRQAANDADPTASDVANRVWIAMRKIRMSSPRWFCGEYGSRDFMGVHIAPVDEQRWVQELLFKDSRVILSSATLTRPMLSQLGIKDREVDFIEVPSTFPVKNRPFTHIPTVRLKWNSTNGELHTWLKRIDAILENRQDRKGIIHAVSYKRARFILENSRHAARMITHPTGGTQKAVEQFKDSEEPLVLVSPSMVEGFDFPDDDCRFQIMAKVPFPNTMDPVTAARSKAIKNYSAQLAAISLAQSYGRGVRSATDWCECFIVDDNAGWFIPKNPDLFPGWFREAFRSLNTVKVPKPM